MKKKSTCLISFLFFATTLLAQLKLSECADVIYRSSQLNQAACDSTVKKIIVKKSGIVDVYYTNNSKQSVLLDSVWGFRRPNQYPVRFFRGNLYTLLQVTYIYKYSSGNGGGKKYFFSNTPDSPVYPIEQEPLKRYSDSVMNLAQPQSHQSYIKEWASGLYGNTFRTLRKVFFGFGMESKYYWNEKWCTGYSLTSAARTTTDNFGLTVGKPLLVNVDIGWTNQYELIQTNNFWVGLNLTNGLSIMDLSDGSVLVRKRYRYGYRYVASQVAANYNYLLSPGVDFRFRLFSSRNNDNTFLSVKAGYNFRFGNAEFGKLKDLSGYFFSIGLTSIKFDKDFFK